MHHITISKDIEIGLEDFETEDLVEELLRRKARADIPLDWVVEMLQREGAPTALIAMLKEWDRMPVADVRRLAVWKMWTAG